MTKARFFLHDLSQKSSENNAGLPQEIWGVIFQELEPTFLNSVLRTCRLFNAVASSNDVFNPLLNTFYGDINKEAIDNKQNSAYDAFKQIYTTETSSLTSSARKLLDLCQFNDIPQIQLFELEPDILFEKDTTGSYVLTQINQLCSQATRSILFSKLHRWFERTARDKAYWDDFPMSLLIEPYNLQKLFQYQTENHHTLMDFAVALNQLDFIKQYAEHFKEPYYFSTDRMTHTQAACLFGHLDIVKYLFATDNPLQARPPSPEHPLIYAILGNYYEIIEFLLITHRHQITVHTLQYAAYLAVGNGRITSLEALLTYVDNMADYTYTDTNNLLTLACQNGQREIAHLLINEYPELLDEHFDRCLLLAARAGSTELVSDFLSDIEDLTAYFSTHPALLMNAVGTNHVALVSYLLELGAPVNTANDHGETSLHLAASNGNLAMVKLLLQHNADISLTNRGHLTALDIAKSHPDGSVALYLITTQYEQGKKRKAEADSDEEDTPTPNKTRPRR